MSRRRALARSPVLRTRSAPEKLQEASRPALKSAGGNELSSTSRTLTNFEEARKRKGTGEEQKRELPATTPKKNASNYVTSDTMCVSKKRYTLSKEDRVIAERAKREKKHK